MSDVIRQLPDSVANQIAAGEVIQRPASVIKELVENSVDAGAKHIDIAVVEAGKTSIQVVDDGKGMSMTDARMSFERHATSKIKEASDLYALRTMGFRGEALASIAAVAQVELRTKMETDELGTSVIIEGSKLVSQEPVACPTGSNFMIKNLFFNIPARRKFLKSNQTELSNIMTEIERIALVNTDIAFRFFHNDTELLSLPAGPLRQRIVSLFGKKINQELLSVEVDTPMVKVHGFIGKPESSRKKGARQFFFTNGRYMRHPYYHKAVMDCYENLIPVGEQVSYFLYFDIDPANIDVNIHPTKTEIKFENEYAVWQILSAAVREALGKFNAVPSIDFDTEDLPDIPVYSQDQLGAYVAPPSFDVNPTYNPFETGTTPSYTSDYNARKTDWEPFFGGLPKREVSQEADFPHGEVSFDEDVFPTDKPSVDNEPANAQTGLDMPPVLIQNYQYKNSYIMTSVKSGLMVIHQHRAHIRILFDEFMQQVSGQGCSSQRLLFPELVHFSPAEVPVLAGIMDELTSLGYDIADLGNGTYSINGVPAGIDHVNPVSLLNDIIHDTLEKGTKVREELLELIVLSMAKAAAIRKGQKLTNDEMNDLVDRLLSLRTPNYTPDGKTIISVIQDEEIKKLFK